MKRRPSILRASRVGRLVLTAVAVGALSLASAGPAAADPPIGGCPSPKWELRASPSGDVSGTASVDVNGDGLSCYLEAPEGGGIFTIIDNVVRPR
jgi:hypothetical protein